MEPSEEAWQGALLLSDQFIDLIEKQPRAQEVAIALGMVVGMVLSTAPRSEQAAFRKLFTQAMSSAYMEVSNAQGERPATTEIETAVKKAIHLNS